MPRPLLILIVATFVLAVAAVARSHPAAVSGILARTSRADVVVELRLDAGSVVELLQRAAPGSAPVPKTALASHRDRVATHVRERLGATTDGRRCETEAPRRVEFVAAIDKVVVEVRLRCPPPLRTLQFTTGLFSEEASPHRLAGTLLHRGRSAELLLDTVTPSPPVDLASLTRSGPAPSGSAQSASGATPGDVAGAEAESGDLFRRLARWVALGAEHILLGLDHVLFVISLLVAARRWGELALVVTAFTLAHSVTLSLSALGILEISPRVVEPLIALSLLVVAVENFLCEAPRARAAVTFVFGLVHGFGFAGALRELGLDPEQALVPLAGFNAGVELGQLSIVLVLFPPFLRLRRDAGRARVVRRGVSVLAAVLASGWVVQRLLAGDFVSAV